MILYRYTVFKGACPENLVAMLQIQLRGKINERSTAA